MTFDLDRVTYWVSKSKNWAQNEADRKSLFPGQNGGHGATHLPRIPSSFKVVDIENVSDTKAHTSFNCTTSKCDPSFIICMYQTAVDRYISGALLTSGIWEPYITSAFQQALSRHPGATVIDIGANIGYYSLLASSRHHDVIAVEPYGENQKRLAKGVILTSRQRGGGGHVTLLANAMSDGHRLVSLSRSSDNQGGLRVLEGCGARNGILGFLGSMYGHRVDTKTRPCDIPTLTMDDLLAVINTSSAVIKVDVEGYECRAMGHAQQFLSYIQVPYIFMEWRQMKERQRDPDTACPTHRIRQLSSALSDLGYVPHEVRSGIRLNPFRAQQWQVGDVYWRKREQSLIVPSM